MITNNDIPQLNIPNTATNRMRDGRSGASVGQVVPSTLQTANEISAVITVNTIATIVTTYNAKLR